MNFYWKTEEGGDLIVVRDAKRALFSLRSPRRQEDLRLDAAACREVAAALVAVADEIEGKKR